MGGDKTELEFDEVIILFQKDEKVKPIVLADLDYRVLDLVFGYVNIP